MGPPADRLYAVDPVAVETITPSAEYVLRYSPLTYISKSIILKAPFC